MEIKTDQQYEFALSEINRLWGSPIDTPDGDFLDKLIDDVVAYENIHYPFNTTK